MNILKLVIHNIVCATLFGCQTASNQADFVKDVKEFDDVNNTINYYGIDTLLIEYSKDELLPVYDQFADSIALLWGIDKSQIVVNNYLMIDAENENIQNIKFQYGDIILIRNIPEHIYSSFRKEFVCKSPEYIKKHPRVRSMTIPYFKRSVPFLIEIIALKKA